MANEVEVQESPQFFKKLAEQDREELLNFIKNQMYIILKENPDLERKVTDATRSEAVSFAVDSLAKKTGDTEEDVLLKALTLYEVATDAVNKGHRLALLGPDYKFIREIIGLEHSRPEASQPKSAAS